MRRQLFEDLSTISSAQGIYEIYTQDGQGLKVGISTNLKRRLAHHTASRDSGLRLIPGGNRENPCDVQSKSSILAKHLFYDSSLTPDYDLRTQVGRCAFLRERCFFIVEYTLTIADARLTEKARELTGGFRYVGKVIRR